jgi:DNA-binding SARP family transcriptional activator
MGVGVAGGTTELRLALLGLWSLEGTRDTGIPDPGGGRASGCAPGPAGRRLLAVLALRGPMTRAQVRGTLWPDLPEPAAAGRLRTTLWRLSVWRRAVLVEQGEILRLAPGVAVDVDEMCRAAAALRDTTSRPAPVAQSAFEYDLLPGWPDEWLIVDRERIRQTRLHALEALSARLLAHGRYAEALEAALCAVRADPLRETAHRAVIDVHLAEHNLMEALRQYDRCERTLHLELGIGPSPWLRTHVTSAGLDRDGALARR